MASFTTVNAQRKKAGVSALRPDQKATGRNTEAIVAEQNRVGANSRQAQIEKGEIGAPTGYQVPGQSNTPVSTIYNSPSPFLTRQGVTTGGRIEENAKERLADTTYDATGEKRESITGDAADQKIADQKKMAATTMSNTGQGVKYDAQGNIIPSSGRLPANASLGKNPQADAAAKREKEKEEEIKGTKGYVKKVGYNEDGSSYEYYTEDPGATANAQEEAKNRQAQEDLTGEMQADATREWLDQNMPAPPLESFLAGLPEEQRADAQAVYGPMFDYIDNAMGMLRGNAQSGMDAIGAVGGAMQTYVDAQRARDGAMLDRFDNFYKEQLNAKLDAADSTADAQMREQDLARDRAEFEFNTAIRDQMIQNEKNRKDQLLGLGISGGWRSSRHSADVIEALSAGDRIMSDLRTQKAFMERDFGNKFSDIESEWHSNVVAAHDGYKASSLALLETAMNKAGDLDKMVFDNTKEKINAIQKLKTDFVSSYGLLARDFASTVGDMNKYAIQRAADVEKAKYEKQNKTWDQALKYVDTYGTQNKAALRIYEDAMGLMPGALSDQKTIEELRLKKDGGGSGVPGSVGNRVDQKVSEILSIYPNANMNDVLTMAYHELDNEIGGESNGGRTKMDSAKQYMYSKYGSQLPGGTRIDTILNERTKDGQVLSTYEDAKQNAYYGSTLGGQTVTEKDAVKTYKSLVDGGWEKKDAQEYVKKFGWEVSDPAIGFTGASKKK